MQVCCESTVRTSGHFHPGNGHGIPRAYGMVPQKTLEITDFDKAADGPAAAHVVPKGTHSLVRVHTRAHARTHIRTHARTHAHTHARNHANTPARLAACMCTRKQCTLDKEMQHSARADTCMRVRAHTHACTHARSLPRPSRNQQQQQKSMHLDMSSLLRSHRLFRRGQRLLRLTGRAIRQAARTRHGRLRCGSQAHTVPRFGSLEFRIHARS